MPTALGFRVGHSGVQRRAHWSCPHPSSLAPPLPPATALDYVLDGDTDRRLRGQVPRVTFLSRGPDDPKHQSSGTVWLKHQHDRVCGDTMLQLQVDADPLASEGHCHRIISFSGFFPASSLTHSHLSLKSQLLGWFPFGLTSLLPAAFLHLLSSSLLPGDDDGKSIFLCGPQSPESWLFSLL